MAEAVGLGASILTLVSFGINVIKTLRSFSGSYSCAEQRITDLSNDVTLTVSLLTELSTTVTQYETEFKITAHNFQATKEGCERNFGRLEKALREARGEKIRFVNFGGGKVIGDVDGKGKGSERKMTTWDRLKFAIGGEEEMRDLLRSIETAKSNLALLLDWVKLFILRELSKKHLLDEDQAGDLKLLVMHLPMLLKSLKGAGLVPSEPKKKQPDVNEEVNPETDVGMANETAKGEMNTVADKFIDENDTAKINIAIVSTPEKDIQSAPLKGTRAAILEPLTPLLNGKSEDVHIPSNPGLEHRRSLDNHSFYEGWVLEHKVKTAKPDSMMLVCGLKIKIFSKEYKRHKYTMSALSKDKSRLEKYILRGKRDRKDVGQEPSAFDDEMLASMPKEAQKEIRSLLRDRNGRAGPYGWKMVALDSTFGKEDRYFWKRLLSKPTKWLVVLRGGVIEKDKDEIEDLPDRFSTPWNVSDLSLSLVDDFYSVTDSSSATGRNRYKMGRPNGRIGTIRMPGIPGELRARDSGYRTVDPNAYGGAVGGRKRHWGEGDLGESENDEHDDETPSEASRHRRRDALREERSIGSRGNEDGVKDVALGDGEAELLMDELLANFTAED
ncbi:hypothetical protein IFR05_005505 [Cadophora sp. M221]|nr:hypothetical protein IFR05_005505 [Cadophora sp. M221]